MATKVRQEIVATNDYTFDMREFRNGILVYG